MITNSQMLLQNNYSFQEQMLPPWSTSLITKVPTKTNLKLQKYYLSEITNSWTDFFSFSWFADYFQYGIQWTGNYFSSFQRYTNTTKQCLMRSFSWYLCISSCKFRSKLFPSITVFRIFSLPAVFSCEPFTKTQILAKNLLQKLKGEWSRNWLTD